MFDKNKNLEQDEGESEDYGLIDADKLRDRIRMHNVIDISACNYGTEIKQKRKSRIVDISDGI